MKQCTKCGCVKPFEAFYRLEREDRRSAYRPHCKECMRAAQLERPKSKRDPAKKAEYARRKGERACEYIPQAERQRKAAEKRQAKAPREPLHNGHVKVWRQRGANARRVERWRAAYQQNPEFALEQRLRTQLRKKASLSPKLAELMRAALNREGESRRVERVCGYTIAQLREHLQSQFTDGMDWAAFARGEIHIDHRVPQAAFDLTDEDQLRACWSLDNLQPLWARDNLAKGARWMGEAFTGPWNGPLPCGQLRAPMFAQL